MISSEQISFQVFEAIEDEKYLPINTRLGLEYLSIDDDGIFKTQKAWKAFVNGNFLSDCSKGHWRDNVKESTIKKYCYPVDEYKHLFVAKIGQDKYIQVSADEIELEYTYILFYSKNSDFPSGVEIYVEAKIK